MKKIKIKQIEVVVDDEVFEAVSQFKWRLIDRYIATSFEGTTLYLHHFVFGKPLKGFVIDHKNNNRFDNRKENLRVCTQQENRMNSRVNKNNSSGFKGVVKRPGRYTASIAKKHLGSFRTAKQAAKAYNDAAIEMFGEFAHLNQI